MAELRDTETDMRQSLWKRWGKTLVYCSLGALLLTSLTTLLTCWHYGGKVTSVSLQYVGDAPEVRDPRLPLGETHLPDYRLEVDTGLPGFWIFNPLNTDLGTIENQSACDGLEFKIEGGLARDKIVGLILLEADALDDDEIVSVDVTSDKLTSKGYTFKINTERSLAFGWERISNANFGLILLIAIFVLGPPILMGTLEVLFMMLMALLAASVSAGETPPD